MVALQNVASHGSVSAGNGPRARFRGPGADCSVDVKTAPCGVVGVKAVGLQRNRPPRRRWRPVSPLVSDFVSLWAADGCAAQHRRHGFIKVSCYGSRELLDAVGNGPTAGLVPGQDPEFHQSGHVLLGDSRPAPRHTPVSGGRDVARPAVDQAVDELYLSVVEAVVLGEYVQPCPAHGGVCSLLAVTHGAGQSFEKPDHPIGDVH